MKRFIVVIPRGDEGVEVHLMKVWLRRHPEAVPVGLDADASTSRQLRDGLRQQGWSVQESATEIRLMPPGCSRFENLVETVLGEIGMNRSEHEPGLRHCHALLISFNIALRRIALMRVW